MDRAITFHYRVALFTECDTYTWRFAVIIHYLHYSLTYWLNGDLAIARDGDRESLTSFYHDIIYYCDRHRQICSSRVKGQGLMYRSEVIIYCGIRVLSVGMASNSEDHCVFTCGRTRRSEEDKEYRDICLPS